MKDKKNTFNYLKSIQVPEIENKAHFEDLKNKLMIELQKTETGKKKNIDVRFRFRLAFSFGMLFVLIPLFLTVTFFIPKNLKLSNAQVVGFVSLKKSDKEEYKKVSKITDVKKNYSIKTDKNNFASFRISGGYNINLIDETEIKILNSSVKMNREEVRIFIKNGKAEFFVQLPSKDALFRVESEMADFTVKGTRFSVLVLEGKETELIVSEGNVKISGYIKNIEGLTEIKKADKNLFKRINDFLNEEIVVSKKHGVLIKKEEMEMLTQEIQKIVFKVKEKKEDVEIISSEIEKLKKIRDDLFYKKNEITEKSKKKNFIVSVLKKISSSFEEKNTAITKSSKNIFISSDLNNSIYCLDFDGNLIFQFKDKDLKIINSVPAFINNDILIPSTDFIYILNENGKLKAKEEIKNGPEYWAAPVLANNKLFVPVSKKVLQYDGNKISDVFGNINNGGQLYITIAYNKIFFNDLNNKKIKEFDLIKNKIVWESSGLDQRAFMSPVISGSKLFIADASGGLYKFDYSRNEKPEKLKCNAGVMGNMILISNILYFITIDGNFYKTDSKEFKKLDLVVKIDNEKNSDKFLTKKIEYADGNLFYCSQEGNLFRYDIAEGSYEFIKISQNANLVGSPVFINNSIYLIDSSGNFYKVNVN